MKEKVHGYLNKVEKKLNTLQTNDILESWN